MKKLDDSIIGGDIVVNIPNRVDDIFEGERLVKTESDFPEKQDNTGVLSDTEMPRLKSLHRRFFTSSKVKNEVEDSVIRKLLKISVLIFSLI